MPSRNAPRPVPGTAPDPGPPPPSPGRASGLSPVLSRLLAVWRPGMFHGFGRRGGHFEGWYFKAVDREGRRAAAVIPGVFLGAGGRRGRAFVMTLDGRSGRTSYREYPLGAFRASPRAFDFRIGPNRFSSGGMDLDLDGATSLRGRLRFGPAFPWPVRPWSPGVMGRYAFAPFMECYHGVLSLDHAVDGVLEWDGRPVDFGGGRGYIEKDWGRSFPRAWVWVQSNHFGKPGISFFASVARIPWRGGAFRGFIAGLLAEGRLHRFATYTGARIGEIEVSANRVSCRFEGRGETLVFEAARPGSPGLLHAPAEGSMTPQVRESLTGRVRVRLLEKASGRVIFEGAGRHAGFEAGGETDWLLNAR